jgi:hypothetical protein
MAQEQLLFIQKYEVFEESQLQKCLHLYPVPYF